jgi:hypothetical protein
VSIIVTDDSLLAALESEHALARRWGRAAEDVKHLMAWLLVSDGVLERVQETGVSVQLPGGTHREHVRLTYATATALAYAVNAANEVFRPSAVTVRDVKTLDLVQVSAGGVNFPHSEEMR